MDVLDEVSAFDNYELGIVAETYTILQVSREKGMCLVFFLKFTDDTIHAYAAAAEFGDDYIRNHMDAFMGELSARCSRPIFVDGDILQHLRDADERLKFGLPQVDGRMTLVEHCVASTYSKLVSVNLPYVATEVPRFQPLEIAEMAEKVRIELGEREEFVAPENTPMLKKRKSDDALPTSTTPNYAPANGSVHVKEEKFVPAPDDDVSQFAMQRGALLSLVDLDRNMRDAMPFFTERQKKSAESLLRQANALMKELLL